MLTLFIGCVCSAEDHLLPAFPAFLEDSSTLADFEALRKLRRPVELGEQYLIQVFSGASDFSESPHILALLRTGGAHEDFSSAKFVLEVTDAGKPPEASVSRIEINAQIATDMFEVWKMVTRLARYPKESDVERLRGLEFHACFVPNGPSYGGWIPDRLEEKDRICLEIVYGAVWARAWVLKSKAIPDAEARLKAQLAELKALLKSVKQ